MVSDEGRRRLWGARVHVAAVVQWQSRGGYRVFVRPGRNMRESARDGCVMEARRRSCAVFWSNTRHGDDMNAGGCCRGAKS
jgi:hypothetical protein